MLIRRLFGAGAGVAMLLGLVLALPWTEAFSQGTFGPPEPIQNPIDDPTGDTCTGPYSAGCNGSTISYDQCEDLSNPDDDCHNNKNITCSGVIVAYGC